MLLVLVGFENSAALLVLVGFGQVFMRMCYVMQDSGSRASAALHELEPGRVRVLAAGCAQRAHRVIPDPVLP